MCLGANSQQQHDGAERTTNEARLFTHFQLAIVTSCGTTTVRVSTIVTGCSRRHIVVILQRGYANARCLGQRFREGTAIALSVAGIARHRRRRRGIVAVVGTHRGCRGTWELIGTLWWRVVHDVHVANTLHTGTIVVAAIVGAIDAMVVVAVVVIVDEAIFVARWIVVDLLAWRLWIEGD